MTSEKNAKGPVDLVWRFFASVRLSVVLLLTLAATSIIGTLIPQNADPMLYERKFGPSLYKVFAALDLFNMYQAWWFKLLLCLLIANILVCSINRLKATWKIIFPKTPKFQAQRFRKSPTRIEWQRTEPIDSLKNAYEAYIRKRFRNTRVEADGSAFLIFGEKGRWTRLGVYGVHLSVLLLMLGGLIGAIVGYEGYMNIPEGEAENHFTLRNANAMRELDFSIRCDDFSVTTYPSGRPKEYRSEITIIDKGQEVLSHKLIVNDPLKYKGISIFQSSYGQTAGDSFTVVFSDNASGMRFQKEASLGETIEMPAGQGKLEILDFTSNFAFRGHGIGPAFICRLIPATGDPQQLVLPLEFPRFDRMRGGDYTIGIENVEQRYYTGLQITYDPGVPLVYAGFIIMIIGCYVTFFMFHQKVCIELIPAKNKTTVAVAGISAKNRPGAKHAVNRLAKQVQRLQPKA